MRRLFPLLVIAALAAPAAADGWYFTEGVGGSRIKDEVADKMGDSGFRFKVGVGRRSGAFALEGWVAADLGSAVSPETPYDMTGLTQVGLDLKYLQRISPHLEVYLRGSLSHGALDDQDYSGRGLGAGAGIQLKGRGSVAGLLFWPLFFTKWGPKMTAALYLDEGYDFLRLHPGGKLDAGPAIDAQLTHLTFGFAVGSDF